MTNLNFENYELEEADGVFTYKNENTTLVLQDLMMQEKLNIYLLILYLENKV